MKTREVNIQLTKESVSQDVLDLVRSNRSQILIRSFLSGRAKRTIEEYAKDLNDFRMFIRAETMEEAAVKFLSQNHGDANAAVHLYRN